MLNSPHSARLAEAAPGRRGALSKGCLVGLALGGGLLLLVLIVGGSFVSRYNAIKSEKTVVDSKWAEIDNQYKRRNDLVDNLVSTVKGAANFERSTLESVVQARANATRAQLPAPPDDPAKLQEYIAAQQQLGGALSRLLVVAEQYPELRATQAFRDLMVSLEGTENRIGVARRDYIDAVQRFNKLVTTFPGNIVAGFANMKELPQMQAATPEERAVPKVDFGTEPK
jgi:LemA protein